MGIPKMSWLVLACVAAVGLPQVAQAQKPDLTLAQRGKKLFEVRQCYGCHTFGRHLAGPDLAGVTARRSADWIRKFLSDPSVMVRTDSAAARLWDANKGYPVMPTIKMNAQEIEALIQYMQLQDSRKG